MAQLSFLQTNTEDLATWRPQRQAGIERMHTFIPHAGRTYAATRNADNGPGNHKNVSGLSPWLRHRLILEEELLTATLGAHPFSSARKFVQEVFWRTSFKGWLEHHPVVWRRYRSDVAEQIEKLQSDPALLDRLTRAVEGKTDIDCFDAWARELVQTGYLHNHTRMWFASIWIFTLRLPWQLGADFFFRHLLDGDPASNTMSWRWVGGLHTKDRTYLARASNIARFTNGRFNPVGQLSSQAAPLIEDSIGIPPVRLAEDDACEKVCDWAEAADIRWVATPYATVGPAADLITQVKNSLSEKGIELVQVRRPYDTLCWPHTTKGFFTLNKKIPAILKALGLPS